MGKAKHVALVEPPKAPGNFFTVMGTTAAALKKYWILTVVIGLAAVLAIFHRSVFVDDKGVPLAGWTPVVVTLGVGAAVAVVLDRVADAYDARISALEFQGAEDTAENAVRDLNTFLGQALATSAHSPEDRVAHLDTLRQILVMCAAKSIGPGTRATYYTLSYATDGSRILGDPEHQCEVGRSDKPERPWIESDNPSHEIWKIMDGPDEEPQVRHVTEVIDGLNWSKKPYDTFVSVPVKFKDQQFGLLSVNCSKDGSIAASQRAAILAMARTMALTLALSSWAGSRIDTETPESI